LTKQYDIVILIMKSKELKAWRNKHQLTQTELGELLGVTKMCVYRWEAGNRKVPAFLHLALESLERNQLKK
jgi:DNA-binding XRE family transcriptional regulator